MFMKLIISIFVLINVSCYGQDTLAFNHHPLIEKEITYCRGSKNQLKCIDSLIQVTLKNTDYSGKGNYPKAYFNRCKKLVLYYSYAGNLSGLRGYLEQSFAYFKQMEIYLDTLNQNGKDKDFIDLKGMAQISKTEFCRKAYFNDTIQFNQCNCIQFFPKFKDEIAIIDTTSPPRENQKPVVEYPNWGEFYINDTLRMNKNFMSDSTSIIYFKKILKPLIQTKLLQNPVYFEMLGDPNMNIKRDTIIYKLFAKYEKGKYERKCETVFTTSKNPEIFDLILFVMGNIELSGHVKSLEIYIPIVVTTENSNNTNNVNIHDDHFLMEIKKIPFIEPKITVPNNK